MSGAAVVAAFIVALYLVGGLALATLVWRDIDRGAEDGRHYWLAVALLIVAWPKAFYDIVKRQ